jgi:HEAT repeat protein
MQSGSIRLIISLLAVSLTLPGWQDTDEKKARIKGIRDYAKQGSGAIPKIEPYLEDRDLEVRFEAVKAIAEIGSPRSIDPLIRATADNDAETQIRATDGLVNFYLPGYLKSGLINVSLKKAASSIKGRFSDTSTEVIDPHVSVRPDVIDAIGKLARGGISMEARANAARAIGILRGKSALPDLYEAVHSKSDIVLYESLIAIQKIREVESGPKVAFLLRDLHERVQIAAIETTGILRNREAIGDLKDVFERARTTKVKRAALTSLAMMPDEGSRPLYEKYFADRDEGLRGAAAEGYGRLKNAADLPVIEKAFDEERKMGPRLSLAFAAVQLGRHELSEFSPLQYLINTLNSRMYRDSAEPLLVELSRDSTIRRALYPAISNASATKEEKIRLARVLSQTGDKDTIPVLEALKGDSDADIAQEGSRAARNLTSRLP